MDRTELIRLRVSPAEKRGIEQRAKQLGYASTSEFVREETLARALGVAAPGLFDGPTDGDGHEFEERVAELSASMPVAEARRRAFAELRQVAA